jgi:CTP:molybdopterin cytidylyltransferase MocA
VIAGLVLAAGGSSRFGAEPKQLAELDGRPLVCHAVDAQLGAGPVERVAVVLGSHADEVGSVLGDEVDLVLCLGWEEGLSASLRAGLAAVEDADWVVVTLADQPRITAQVVAMVCDHVDTRWDAVRATYDGAPGHPVAVGRALRARAGELHGDEGFRALLSGARVRDVEAGMLASAADIDTPADLEAIRG